MNLSMRLFGWRVMPWLMAGLLAAGMLPGTPLADAGSTKRITEGHIDSNCIGDVSDPVCAIETWFACYALEKPELCELLGVEGRRFEPDAQPNIVEYRIIEVLPVASDRPPPTVTEQTGAPTRSIGSKGCKTNMQLCLQTIGKGYFRAVRILFEARRRGMANRCLDQRCLRNLRILKTW